MDVEKEFESFMETGDNQKTAPSPVNPVVDTSNHESAIELNDQINIDKVRPLSAALDNRFKISEKGTKTVYSYSNDPDKIAFTEKSNKIIANDKDNPALIKSMLDVAESKGWESVTLIGSKAFKSETWIEAKSRGLEVSGYEPSEQDQRKLDRLMDKQNSVELSAKDPARASDTLDAKFAAAKQAGDTLEPDTPGADGTSASDQLKSETDSITPISIEGQKNREAELKAALQSMSEKEAVEKYPELEKVYKVAPAASSFFRAKGGMKEQASEFSSRATDRAIEDAASGKSVPEFDVPSYKAPETLVKQTELEIDFD